MGFATLSTLFRGPQGPRFSRKSATALPPPAEPSVLTHRHLRSFKLHRLPATAQETLSAAHRPMTPPRSGTLGDLLDDTAAARPGAEATVFRGERLT